MIRCQKTHRVLKKQKTFYPSAKQKSSSNSWTKLIIHQKSKPFHLSSEQNSSCIKINIFWNAERKWEPILCIKIFFKILRDGKSEPVGFKFLQIARESSTQSICIKNILWNPEREHEPTSWIQILRIMREWDSKPSA